MSDSHKKLIAVIGPTASGKTSLAIKLAKKFETEIISADSRQFFKEMSIGTAKPTPSELAQVPHHFINSLSIKEEYSAGQFEKDALEKIDQLHSQKDVVIMVGGSGLYLNALFNGLDKFPAIDKSIKDKWRSTSLENLQLALQEKDPIYAQMVDLNNPQRLTRALETIEQTGQPYSNFLEKNKVSRPFDIFKIGISWPRAQLYQRINKRVEEMFMLGLEKEAQALLPYIHLNALNTVGYKELFSHYNGEIDREEAIRLIKRNTRRFAKRQLTWFKRDEEIHWIKPAETDAFITKISF